MDADAEDGAAASFENLKKARVGMEATVLKSEAQHNGGSQGIKVAKTQAA